ncbi:MAG: response regulator [Desulfobacteraceae bacterium]|nr:response regulator [Desulfobacteraceae bacterium]
MKEKHEDIIRTGGICPVSGLPVFKDQAWEMGDLNASYRVKFYKIGDNILFSDPAGYGIAQETQNSLYLCNVVEQSILESKGHYVQIENFSNLSGFNLGARRIFIRYFENRPHVHGLIFYGVSAITTLGIRLTAKIAGRMYKDHYPILVVKSYQEAINAALGLLSEKKSIATLSRDNEELSTEADIETNLENPALSSVDSHVQQVLRYLGNLNFSGGHSKEYQPVIYPDTHPFFPVFEHIDMINNDVNNLIQRWQENTKEKDELQKKLMLSQKMEALGLLAGGVAHDLNNVLSGLTTYPEILLMDLPDNHPMRPKLLRILDAGYKASTIVQDLLTLARRGKGDFKVTNLNLLIKNYLKSPEHANLKTKYPKLKIILETNPSLPNIEGSDIHLIKTIMNLVFNAAEAQDHLEVKSVLLRTDHRRLEKEYKGFMDIPQGEYVILEIVDLGMGIDSKDIDRIFEPFYSTKKMGQSGTGLGMAVVWWTMEDHKAFIDVKTGAHSGTSFFLYFPVTSQKLIEKEKQGPELYYGNKETVLVIDDVQSQREIAVNILERLGYTVETAESGEKAIEFLKNNQMDLLLLDMIMEPGMDGHETYQKILKFRPDQKAIIVSGFTEIGMVKKVREMGARQYIRKPYNVENISKAVYKELRQL